MSWNPFETNHLIMNLDGNEFIKIGYLFGVSFENDSRCTISGDIDNDGLTDLIFSTTRHHSYFIDGKFPDESVYVFKNEIESAKSNNWLGISLKQGKNGFHPIGSNISVMMENGKKYKKSMINGDSIRSVHSMKKIFGLGEQSNIKYVEVQWPNGILERIGNPSANKYFSFPSDSATITKLNRR